MLILSFKSIRHLFSVTFRNISYFIISCKDTDNPPYINWLVESFLVVREVVDIFWHNKSEFFGLDCTHGVCKLKYHTIYYIYQHVTCQKQTLPEDIVPLIQRRGSINLIMAKHFGSSMFFKCFNKGGVGPQGSTTVIGQ